MSSTPSPPTESWATPTLPAAATADDAAAPSSSSISSPTSRQSDEHDVDALLEGIDRARIDDLWTTPRSAAPSPATAAAARPWRAGLFAAPGGIFGGEAIGMGTRSASVPSVPATLAPRVEDLVAGPEFPAKFKTTLCKGCDAEIGECFFWHAEGADRRRPNFGAYKPHMCRFVEEIGGCRKGDRCPFSHNDFERRYHPDRFGKETCRDFLRGDCPRRYCTFRHEVSGKVERAIAEVDGMDDKELLQLVLKIGELKGKALSEKLLRRFGHGRKHSGWKLEGFVGGVGDQKVKFVAARVDALKKVLKAAGEKKWAASLKTTSLRDMMSGVRKVAEEVRERHRDERGGGGGGGGGSGGGEAAPEMHRLIRSVFSSTNWSCHSQDGDNPFLVTPENQNDAVTSLERLIDIVTALAAAGMAGGASRHQYQHQGLAHSSSGSSDSSQGGGGGGAVRRHVHHSQMHHHHHHHQQFQQYGRHQSHQGPHSTSNHHYHQRHRMQRYQSQPTLQQPYVPEMMPHQSFFGQAPTGFEPVSEALQQQYQQNGWTGGATIVNAST